MAKPECWSRTVGNERGSRIRVYEREVGGMLYASAWLPGTGESRRSLGHRDRARALREAHQLLQVRENAVEPEELDTPITLGALFARYGTDGRYLANGSLKTDAYLQHIAATGRNLSKHFTSEALVPTLTPDRIGEYVRLRRSGAITGNCVRTNAIERELTILKGALNWARGQHINGRPLLLHNPLETYRIPSERDPKRPVVGELAVAKLLAAGAEVHPYLYILIVLARTTGRRLNALLGLRWDDIDFEEGTIRWRAERDKLRKTWVVPVARRTLGDLLRFRTEHPGVGTALLFPHPKTKRHPGKPVTPDLAAYWLKRAVKLTGATKPDGSLWHAFRRLWATERKGLPVKDVAAAGGWTDVTTLIECYQQPDEETLRDVVEFVKPARRERPVEKQA